MSFTRVIPGHVINNGITDKSNPIIPLTLSTYPCHFPVLSVITPKGPMGQQTIYPGDFTAIYGNIFDPTTPYYNPIGQLILAMTRGGQASIGVRRLSANDVKARLIVGLKVTEGKINEYERTTNGKYKLTADGKRIIKSQRDGIKIAPVILKADVDTKIGETQVKSEGADTHTYPLFELVSGIGDFYNNMIAAFGLSYDSDWGAVSDFVNEYGIFPYDFSMGSLTKSGIKSVTHDVNGVDINSFTLFDMMDSTTLKYGIKEVIGMYTGDNVNRPHQSKPAPFMDAYVYKENIDEIAQALFAIESAEPKSKLIKNKFGEVSYRQMNLLGGVYPDNIPYYAIELDTTVTEYSLQYWHQSSGGISPFYLEDGTLPVNATAPAPGRLKILTTMSSQLNRATGWDINQQLILADLTEYKDSLMMVNYIRNRQSVMYDLGYNDEIKELLIEMLGVRKDHKLYLHAGYHGQTLSLAQRYSLAQSLSAKCQLTPESSKSGTPACRAMVNLWDGKIINESTGDRFTLLIDLAYAYAKFGGNSEGKLFAANSPDHGDNRVLQIMYDPTVDFESLDAASNNFTEGCLTIRPYDKDMYYRPALPTVYSLPNSVLKDDVTTSTCIAIEKILQDQWSIVSGDTTISKLSYQAIVKDNAERAIRDNYGSVIAQVRVETFFDETRADARSTMRAVAHVWFNKGYYMLDMDLYAYNEQDLETTSN